MVTTMISNCFETDLSSHANISKWLQVAILKGETVKTDSDDCTCYNHEKTSGGGGILQWGSCCLKVCTCLHIQYNV